MAALMSPSSFKALPGGMGGYVDGWEGGREGYVCMLCMYGMYGWMDMWTDG